jgi:polyisoprenyl-teichoic acid--peptidoglycan teichoic acid transferase
MRPKGRRRLSHTWLLVGLIALSLVGALTLYRPFDVKSSTAAAGEEAGQTLPPAKLPGERVTFLVMGVDKRDDDAGRADSMVVVSLDPNTQQLALLSLARDTWVQIPGHGYDKVNHSYAFGGERLAVQAVQRLLGIPIDHYVTLNFQGFARIVDALGGIDIDAEKRMLYNDPYDTGMGPGGLVIDIQPGLQHMDGLTALKYARYRMDDEGDVGRMRRQQQVVKALMKAAATPAILTRIPQLIPALADAVDTDLSVGEMLKLATGARDALSHPLKAGSLNGEEKMLGGIFYWIPDLVKERATAYELLVGSTPPEEFLNQAREEQQVYARALAEVTAEDERAAKAEADKAGQQEPQGGTAAGQPGTQAPGSQPQASGTLPPVTTSPPATKPPAVTVAVLDASGAGIGPDYVKKLKAAGFRVARSGKSAKPVARTVVLDHAGQPGTKERIQQVLPDALVVAARDSKAEEAVEIILGADLAAKPQN